MSKLQQDPHIGGGNIDYCMQGLEIHMVINERESRKKMQDEYRDNIASRRG